VLKQYFPDYNDAMSNDFVLSADNNRLELMSSDIHDWRITFVDTGANANIGQRLRRSSRCCAATTSSWPSTATG
jgi:glucose-1-phosphate cytidylyltransferase